MLLESTGKVGTSSQCSSCSCDRLPDKNIQYETEKLSCLTLLVILAFRNLSEGKVDLLKEVDYHYATDQEFVKCVNSTSLFITLDV